jgi:polyphosphate kinase
MTIRILEDLWLDRDLAWLEFNRRVLAEALDERTPLLERLKFLAIFTSNLDEFFMKRIALLRVENNGTHTKLLEDLRTVIISMVNATGVFARSPSQAARHSGLAGKITDRQRVEATKFFQQNALPALTRWLLTRCTDSIPL